MGQLGNLLVVGLLTIASGLLDARGFVYAARAWPGGQLDVKMGLASLAALGVRRISVGAALARVAWGAFMTASKSIAATGTFDALESAARFDELNAIFHERK